MKAFLRRSSEEEEAAPLFVFDADYDPAKLGQGLEDGRARSSSVCGRGGASTVTRASRIRPHMSDALVGTVRR